MSSRRDGHEESTDDTRGHEGDRVEHSAQLRPLQRACVSDDSFGHCPREVFVDGIRGEVSCA
jgi:hypothetical protein